MLVGYMRVSSDNDRQTTDLQRDALLAAGVDPRHLCEDKASGARDDRPGLQQALASVRPGDCLVIWKLDRLGRSLSHLFHVITTFQAQGVAWRSLTEPMDPTTPQGAFLLRVFGALAQERIRAGLEAARHRGKRGGRPQAISAEQLEAILAALHAGASKASLCRTFGGETHHPRMMPWRALQRSLFPSSRAGRDRVAPRKTSVVAAFPWMRWQHSVADAMRSLFVTTRG